MKQASEGHVMAPQWVDKVGCRHARSVGQRSMIYEVSYHAASRAALVLGGKWDSDKVQRVGMLQISRKLDLRSADLPPRLV